MIVPIQGLLCFLIPLIFNKTKPTTELKDAFSAANLPQRHKVMITEADAAPADKANTVAPEPTREN